MVCPDCMRDVDSWCDDTVGCPHLENKEPLTIGDIVARLADILSSPSKDREERAVEWLTKEFIDKGWQRVFDRQDANAVAIVSNEELEVLKKDIIGLVIASHDLARERETEKTNRILDRMICK